MQSQLSINESHSLTFDNERFRLRLQINDIEVHLSRTEEEN